jgi:urease accessory protein
MNSQDPSSIPKIHAGGGRIALSSYGSNAVFSELSSTYPLKLLSPRISQGGIAVVYILSYGGGLVGGDQVNLSVDIDTGTALVLLSQVS